MTIALRVTAFADFIEARRRLVKEYAAEGLAPEDILARVQLTIEHVEIISSAELDPPIPGCVWDVVRLQTERIMNLERELHGPSTPRVAPDVALLSDVRELAPESRR
jgi:hypothetical protein